LVLLSYRCSYKTCSWMEKWIAYHDDARLPLNHFLLQPVKKKGEGFYSLLRQMCSGLSCLKKILAAFSKHHHVDIVHSATCSALRFLMARNGDTIFLSIGPPVLYRLYVLSNYCMAWDSRLQESKLVDRSFWLR